MLFINSIKNYFQGLLLTVVLFQMLNRMLFFNVMSPNCMGVNQRVDLHLQLMTAGGICNAE